MWTTLWQKIKEALKKMIPGKSIEKVLHVAPIMSSEMADALELWDDMYKNQAPWIRNEATADNPVKIVSLGLPSMIASEKARMAVLEMKSEITVPTEDVEVEVPDENRMRLEQLLNDSNKANDKKNNNTNEDKKASEDKEKQPQNKGTNIAGQKANEDGSEPIEEDAPTRKEIQKKPVSAPDRAEWLNEAYQEKIIHKIRPQLEYGIAKGGFVMKPYIIMKKKINEQGKEEEKPSLEVEFIQADGFYPLAFNGSGDITEAAFVQTKIDKNTTYRRLEHHILEGTTVTVRNKAFKSDNNQVAQVRSNSDAELGREVPLTEVPEWAELKPEQKIKNVDRLLFAYFKMPEANTIDTMSPLGVSGYSRAVRLIKEADLQFSRLAWEFEATEAAIDVDRDALLDVKGRDGKYHYVNATLQQRLFRPIDLGESNTYQPYLPAIRDVSIINGLNSILMRIEDTCALSRGTLSDVTSEAKTATELKILKQRSYQANASIQEALEHALKDVVYVMNVYATLYKIVPEGEYEASFEWDDSILVDVETELSKRITLMQNGLSSKLELRMWYFGETEEQAREALAKVKEESIGDMEENMMNQMTIGERTQSKYDELD